MTFLQNLQKKLGHFVGISEHVGHALTFNVLTVDTKKIIHRSRIRSALNPKERNLRVDPKPDDPHPKFCSQSTRMTNRTVKLCPL